MLGSILLNISLLNPPSWSNLPKFWDLIINEVKKPTPPFKECFIHCDYYPTNIVCDGNKLCGVVDWVSACIGPAGIDVGHCRINLAILFDVSTADSFLSAYQKYAGTNFNYNPHWDFVSLLYILVDPLKIYPGWIAFGVEDLTDQINNEAS